MYLVILQGRLRKMISKAVIVLFIAGAGIPTMAALDSGLGVRLGNPVQAAFALFLLAAIVTFLLALANPLPTRVDILSVPVHFYFGGLFVAFYVLAITWIAPRFGLGNAIVVVLFGQLIAAAVIDHFALLGALKAPITWTRAMGIGFILLGVFLARKPITDM